MGPRNADAMHKTQGNLVPRRQDVFWIPAPLSSFHRNEQGPTDTVSRLSIIHTREAFHKNVCESRRCHQDTKEIKNINFSLWVSGFSQKESSGQAIHTAEMNAVEKGGKKKKKQFNFSWTECLLCLLWWQPFSSLTKVLLAYIPFYHLTETHNSLTLPLFSFCFSSTSFLSHKHKHFQ